MREITDIDELKRIELNLLKLVHSFCRERGIRHSLAGGTLLGAIRHKGFIPWDDDVDVMMPRPDYERFCREFSASDASVHTFKNDQDYFYPYAKVYDDRTMAVEDRDPRGHSAVCIDVFPIDGLSDGSGDPRSALRVQRLCYAALSLRRAPPLFRRRSVPKQVALWIAAPLRILPESVRCSVCRTMLRRLTARLMQTPFEDAPFAGPLTWGNGIREVHPRSAFGIGTEVEFEGATYPAIDGWREYLSADYGDFMTPPPPEKRVSHHAFRAWWKDGFEPCDPPTENDP